MTVTNNTVAGQPVSMQNIRETAELCHAYQIPVVFDASRYAENIYFIKKYEPGYSGKTLYEIAKEMFSYCDA